MGIGQLPTSSGGMYTCDTRYFDSGRACAWNNFLCEEYTTTGIVPASFPACFDGLQQSPIDLDKSEATVGDPGQITFSGFDTQLTQKPVVRLKSYTLQLDFKQTLTLSAGTTSSIRVNEEEILVLSALYLTFFSHLNICGCMMMIWTLTNYLLSSVWEMIGLLRKYKHTKNHEIEASNNLKTHDTC